MMRRHALAAKSLGAMARASDRYEGEPEHAGQGRHRATVMWWSQLLDTHTSVPSSGMVKAYCALFILLFDAVT